MRYVVLDTDVASRAIKGTLGDPLRQELRYSAEDFVSLPVAAPLG
jgi:hypothetical protein